MKHMSGHLRNSGTKKAYEKPEDKGKPEPKAPTGNEKKAPGPTDPEANAMPHPMTGVKSVSAHHMGGGKYTTHTHHEDGGMQEDHHENAASMHAHVAQSLPEEGMEQEQGAPGPPMQGGMSSLGGIE
jgi:hypothetical protein